VSKIDDVLERLRDDSAAHELGPPATEEDIRRTEQAIDAPLPPSEVAYLDTSSRKLYAPMASFAHWLEWLAEHSEDEVIRTYYVDDDEVLYDEMMLG
jgi:hypothetical protein